MATKKSALKKEYQRERKRVQSLLNRYRKKYYSVEVTIPNIPKRITQGSINRLKKITPTYVQSKTFDVNTDTGELIKYTPKRKRSSKVTTPPPQSSPVPEFIPSYESIVLQNFFNQISAYPPKMQKLVRDWYTAMKNAVGEDTYKLIDVLQDGAEKGLWATYQEAYNATLVMENLSEMLEMLDVSGAEKRSILEELAKENDFYEEYQ